MPRSQRSRWPESAHRAPSRGAACPTTPLPGRIDERPGALAEGDPRYDELERRLAQGPVIRVPKITLDGDSDGVAPASDGTSHALLTCPVSDRGPLLHVLEQPGLVARRAAARQCPRAPRERGGLPALERVVCLVQRSGWIRTDGHRAALPELRGARALHHECTVRALRRAARHRARPCRRPGLTGRAPPRVTDAIAPFRQRRARWRL